MSALSFGSTSGGHVAALSVEASTPPLVVPLVPPLVVPLVPPLVAPLVPPLVAPLVPPLVPDVGCDSRASCGVAPPQATTSPTSPTNPTNSESRYADLIVHSA